MVQEVEPPPGRLVRLGVVVRPGDPAGQSRLARMCDLAGVDVLWVEDEQVAVAIAADVARAQVLVLPPTDEPWARTVPVSVGRTPAEAEARAALDPTLGRVDDLAARGLFGTLETAQLRVIELAHAGVTDLRCILPDVPDVHDVVAQLTAVVVGSPATHHPDAPRSADPAPPPWAGRRPIGPPPPA